MRRTTRLRPIAILIVSLGFFANGLSGEVVAGGASKTVVGDLPARSAPFEYPEALGVDHDGNLLVAASRLHQVFRLSKSGDISLVAGSGKRGFGGDGGAAVDASLDYP